MHFFPRIFHVDAHRTSERHISIFFSILGYLSLLVYPVFALLIMDYHNYKALFPNTLFSERLQIQLAEFRPQLMFSVCVIYVSFLILLLLVRKAWIATAALSSVSLLCAFINFMKIRLNNNPFIPMDISLIGQSKELLSYISIPMPRLFWVFMAVAAIWVVYLAFAHIEIPGKWYYSSPAGLFLLVLVVFCFSDSDRTTSILAKYNMNLFDNALQTSNYSANGFVGGFTLNILGMNINVPDDYNETTIDEILSDYEFMPSAPNAEAFDVVLVLSESFFDLRQLNGVTYSEDPLPNYTAILNEENCYSGNIYTIAKGGGTVNTEFRILTGLSTDYLLPNGATPYNYVTSDLPGFVTNYRDAGYNTIGLHLYNPNFYSRKRSYPYLGFDRFLTTADVENTIPISYTRGYATDSSTEAAIEYYLDESSKTGKPTFLFAVTIENHQPFQENEDNTITVTSDLLDDTELQSLATYTQGVKDADTMLGRLKDYIDSRVRPTVLVWYGDHLPSLGHGNDFYEKLGYCDSQNVAIWRKQLFHTPFLVYSNRPLSQGLFSSKQNNQISDIYLLECVAESTGFQQTTYMQYLSDSIRKLPVFNVELSMEDTLNEEQANIVKSWMLVAYDRMLGKKYSVKGFAE